MTSEAEYLGTGALRPVRVHLTNVAGMGAVQLVRSLLPALENCPGYRIEEMYLPDRGELRGYRPASSEVRTTTTRRLLPNSFSRLVECTVGGSRLDGITPLLVLGDLPLRCKSAQTLFVQTPLLTRHDQHFDRQEGFRHRIARGVFRHNLGRVSAAIVQTGIMKSALLSTYPGLRGRVHIVGQPVPEWLLQRRSSDCAPVLSPGRLRLFYPAATYPHKNHALLAAIDPGRAADWPIQSLVLTIEDESNPNPAVTWIRCEGRLDPARMIDAYESADGLVFLSLSESYGFPLVEAMWMGLPVICPDLPYARWLCGDPAIYFAPTSIDSLSSAVIELDRRLRSGWRPDWRAGLAKLPRDWASVARSILEITTNGEVGAVALDSRNEGT